MESILVLDFHLQEFLFLTCFTWLVFVLNSISGYRVVFSVRSGFFLFFLKLFTVTTLSWIPVPSLFLVFSGFQFLGFCVYVDLFLAKKENFGVLRFICLVWYVLCWDQYPGLKEFFFYSLANWLLEKNAGKVFLENEHKIIVNFRNAWLLIPRFWGLSLLYCLICVGVTLVEEDEPGPVTRVHSLLFSQDKPLEEGAPRRRVIKPRYMFKNAGKIYEYKIPTVVTMEAVQEEEKAVFHYPTEVNKNEMRELLVSSISNSV